MAIKQEEIEKLLKEGFSFEYPVIEDYAKALRDE